MTLEAVIHHQIQHLIQVHLLMIEQEEDTVETAVEEEEVEAEVDTKIEDSMEGTEEDIGALMEVDTTPITIIDRISISIQNIPTENRISLSTTIIRRVT